MAKPDLGTYGIQLSEGLKGQEANLDILNALFEQLQVATVEAADPHLDLITFAESAYYFAVITEHYILPLPKLEVKGEDSIAEHMKAADKVAKLEGAAKEKAYVEQLLESLAEWKGSSSPVPLWPSHPSVSTRTQNQLSDFHEEATRLRESPSTASVAKNSEAIGSNVSFEYAVDDGLLRTAQWQREYIQQRSEEKLRQSTPALPEPTHPIWQRNDVVGIVYLTTSQNMEDPLHVGELNIGIILAEQARGKGYARRAIEMVTDKAFEVAKCHRLQAILLNHVAKDRALCLFTEIGFSHEGTRRHSFYSPMEFEWKDATYMAIIETDWVLSKSRDVPLSKRSAPKSLWDELFARHQREREELLRWESNTNVALRRTPSTATLRVASPPTALPITPGSEADDSEMSDSPRSPRLNNLQKGKENEGATEDRIKHEGYDVATSDSEMVSDSSNERLSLPAPESPDPFTDDDKDDGPGGYESVSSWDVLELSASSSDDTSDSEDSFYDFDYDDM